MSTSARVFGIDLGTTYSCISVIDESGKPVVLRNNEGDNVTPSIVFFDGDEIIVGKEARERSKTDADRVVEAVKRNMGDQAWQITQGGKDYRPEEISAFILRKVISDAEARLAETGTEEKITDVVITCPAYFGPNEREATKNAGLLANLNVRSIINEPTAAAISYGLATEKDQVVMVYDLGGGTFDVTLIAVKPDGIQVLGTGGDRILGGKDWDAALVNYLAEEFRSQTGSAEDILDDAETLQGLWISAEAAKRTLSSRESTNLRIAHGGQFVKVDITREKFEELTADLLNRTILKTQEMLDEAKQKGTSRFDKILLVGGSSKMPQVTARLKSEFNIEIQMYDPDESVAKGAAIYGQRLALGDEIRLLFERNTGKKLDDSAPLAVEDPQVRKALEQVAVNYGLAPSAVENLTSKSIINVASKSFGIVAYNAQDKEVVFNLVKRNDAVPALHTDTFVTRSDNQTNVAVRLMENVYLTPEASISDSVQIGEATFELPPGLPVNSPIEITIGLNEQGLVEVSGREPKSGKDFSFRVETSGVMTQEEIEEKKSSGLAMRVS